MLVPLVGAPNGMPHRRQAGVFQLGGPLVLLYQESLGDTRGCHPASSHPTVGGYTCSHNPFPVSPPTCSVLSNYWSHRITSAQVAAVLFRRHHKLACACVWHSLGMHVSGEA